MSTFKNSGMLLSEWIKFNQVQQQERASNRSMLITNTSNNYRGVTNSRSIDNIQSNSPQKSYQFGFVNDSTTSHSSDTGSIKSAESLPSAHVRKMRLDGFDPNGHMKLDNQRFNKVSQITPISSNSKVALNQNQWYKITKNKNGLKIDEIDKEKQCILPPIIQPVHENQSSKKEEVRDIENTKKQIQITEINREMQETKSDYLKPSETFTDSKTDDSNHFVKEINGINENVNTKNVENRKVKNYNQEKESIISKEIDKNFSEVNEIQNNEIKQSKNVTDVKVVNVVDTVLINKEKKSIENKNTDIENKNSLKQTETCLIKIENQNEINNKNKQENEKTINQNQVNSKIVEESNSKMEHIELVNNKEINIKSEISEIKNKIKIVKVQDSKIIIEDLKSDDNWKQENETINKSTNDEIILNQDDEIKKTDENIQNKKKNKRKNKSINDVKIEVKPSNQDSMNKLINDIDKVVEDNLNDIKFSGEIQDDNSNKNNELINKILSKEFQVNVDKFLTSLDYETSFLNSCNNLAK